MRMGILQANAICLSFGDRVLLKDASFTLGEHARSALAGGNGEGKTTLMKIVAGLMHCDSGTVTTSRGMTVSYLPQSDIVLRDNTVYEEIEKGFDVWQANLDRQHEIESLLSDPSNSNNANLLHELSTLQEEIMEGPYYRREAVIGSIAKGLGLSESDLKRKCNEFSGGYQMRIALASVLARNPDVLLLDEPTNYLDIEARIWLRNFLKTYSGSFMIVCHDRDFLDQTVNEVYELFHAKLTRYSGNYSFYEKARLQEIKQLEAARRRQEEEIARTEQFIERFRYKATKARQVQSRVKALDKIELVEVPSHLETLSFSFPDPGHSPNDMVRIENLCKSFGDNVIFNNFSLYLAKGKRLAVTGHNGAGKSTLLRIIAGADSAYSGTVRLGPGVNIGYYSQDTADSLDMDGTVFSQVSAYGTEGRIRSALGAFLFHGDDIYKKTSVLSGGERSRLALLKILLQPVNLLILDEPTNHLDINSKTMLLNALAEYKGTIIFVSHDTQFIRELATSILYLGHGEPQLIEGDYDYFEYRMSLYEEAIPTSKVEAKDDTVQTNKQPYDRELEKKKRNMQRKLEREAQALLEKIAALEAELAELDVEINKSENYSDPVKISALVRKREEVQAQKNALEEEWLEKASSEVTL